MTGDADSTTRYAFARFPAGGLLLDLGSGELYSLNDSAAFIWERWLQGLPAEAVADRLALDYGLQPAEARRDVAQALSPERLPGEDIEREYRYERDANGYLVSRRGTPLLAVDEDGRRLQLRQGSSLSVAELGTVLQAVAPKLIALRGHFVLHCSAVLVGGAVTAFCGDSGAGKTTTAKAAVQAGATLLCEDKLVLRVEEDEVITLAGGEKVIRAWAEAAVPALTRGAPADCSPLDDIRDGRGLPLVEVGFLSAARRVGTVIAARPMTGPEAAGAIFRSSFYGSDDPEAWQRQFKTSVRIGGCVASFELTVPDGLTTVGPAIRAVIERGGLRSS
jgi:hypothetical protein